MRPSLLFRRTFWECLQLLAFYLVIFLGLIAIALVTPLARSGAPLTAVLATLPDQLALPGTIAIPLALVTAILGVIGRLREHGELIAIRAAGISSLRITAALLPIAVGCSIFSGLLAHVVLPDAFEGWRQGKASLLQQAVATKVARREFIYQDGHGTAITACSADGNQLERIFAHQVSEDGSTSILYAPTSTWVSNQNQHQETSLQLQLNDAQVLHYTRSDSSQSQQTLGTFPSLVVRLDQAARDFSQKPDTKSTNELTQSINAYSTALALTDLHPDDPREFTRTFLNQAHCNPLQPIDVIRWHHLARLANLQQPPALLASLPPSILGQLKQITEPPAVNTAQQLCASIWETAQKWQQKPSLRALLPLEMSSWDLSATQHHVIARYLINNQLTNAIQSDASVQPLLSIFKRWDPTIYQRDIRGVFTETLREHQMAWHLRWQIAALPLAYWIFACGLALTLPGTSRLLAVTIGLGTVIITLLPAVGLTKSVGESIPFNPGWLMWSTWLMITAYGGLLTWRRR